MATFLDKDYFLQIKQIWQPFQKIASDNGKFIIPFCTPLTTRPPALVIGTNHSVFDTNNSLLATQIAQMYSEKLAETSTYMEHHHNFARQLRRMCGKAGLSLTGEWVGTNRCAVQWDSGNDVIADLRTMAPDEFDACQAKMDELLINLIRQIQPVNVILVGHFACRLFYPNLYAHRFARCTCPPYEKLLPMWVPNLEGTSWIIPIQHPSMPINEKLATERLRIHFRQ